MPFTPVVPMGGLAGLRFVERTYERQLETFARSPDIRREVDYFLAHAGEIRSAEELVGDRRLLRVALGAFGLADEVDKRAFVRKVLEEGTLDPRSLANRLADPAWARLAGALGFGDAGGMLVFEGVRRDIADRFRLRQFERAVGDVDLDVRLALNFKREIGEILASSGTGKSAWLRILGSQPLRRVVEGAFGLPSGFAGLEIDRQVAILRERTEGLFGGGSAAVFSEPENLDLLLRRFLATAGAAAGPPAGTRGAAALALLRTGGLGAGGHANLFASAL